MTTQVEDVRYKHKWAMVWLIFAVECIQFLGYTSYSTQSSNIMQDLGMTYAQFGNLASVSTVALGITILFVGILGDYWSTKKVIVGGLFVMGIGQVLFGMAETYTMILVARAVEGIGIAAVVGGGFTLAEKWTANSTASGASFAVMMSADGVGGLLALYGFTIVMSFVGWRIGATISAVIYAILVIVCIIWLKDYPDQKKAVAHLKATQPNPFAGLGKIIANRTVIGCAAIIIGQTAAYCVVAFWVPTVLMEGAGWTDSMSGLLANLYPVVAIPFLIFCPKFAEKKNTKKLMIGLGAIAVIIFFGLAAAVSMNAYIAMVILMSLLGIFNYCNSTLAFGYAARSVGVESTGLCTQFIQLLGFVLGGAIFPAIMGYARDAAGTYTAGFIIMAISMIVLMVLIPLAIKGEKKTGSELSQEDVA